MYMMYKMSTDSIQSSNDFNTITQCHRGIVNLCDTLHNILYKLDGGLEHPSLSIAWQGILILSCMLGVNIPYV